MARPLRHAAIIVSSPNVPLLAAVRAKAVELMSEAVEGAGKKPEAGAGLVTIIGRMAFTGGGGSFAVMPSGSLKDWDDDNALYLARRALMDHIDSLAFEDGRSAITYAEISFGSNEGSRMVRSGSPEAEPRPLFHLTIS